MYSSVWKSTRVCLIPHLSFNLKIFPPRCLIRLNHRCQSLTRCHFLQLQGGAGFCSFGKSTMHCKTSNVYGRCSSHLRTQSAYRSIVRTRTRTGGPRGDSSTWRRISRCHQDPNRGEEVMGRWCAASNSVYEWQLGKRPAKYVAEDSHGLEACWWRSSAFY